MKNFPDLLINYSLLTKDTPIAEAASAWKEMKNVAMNTDKNIITKSDRGTIVPFTYKLNIPTIPAIVK